MNILKCSLAVKNVNDQVVNIGIATFPQGTTVSALVANNPQYWLEDDTNGNTHLCTTKTDIGPLTGTFLTSLNVNYSIQANNFDTLNFFGGHPVERPHAY